METAWYGILKNLQVGNGESVGSGTVDDDSEGLRTHCLYVVVSDVKCRAVVQPLLIQAVMEIYMYRPQLSATNTIVLFNVMHDVASHAYKISKQHAACII